MYYIHEYCTSNNHAGFEYPTDGLDPTKLLQVLVRSPCDPLMFGNLTKTPAKLINKIVTGARTQKMTIWYSCASPQKSVKPAAMMINVAKLAEQVYLGCQRLHSKGNAAIVVSVVFTSMRYLPPMLNLHPQKPVRIPWVHLVLETSVSSR